MTRYPAVDLAEALAEAERVTPGGADLMLIRVRGRRWDAEVYHGHGSYAFATGATPVEALQGLVARLEPVDAAEGGK